MAESAMRLAGPAILTQPDIADTPVMSRKGITDVSHHLRALRPPGTCQAEPRGSRQSLHDGDVSKACSDTDRSGRRSGAALYAGDRQWRGFLGRRRSYRRAAGLDGGQESVRGSPDYPNRGHRPQTQEAARNGGQRQLFQRRAGAGVGVRYLYRGGQRPICIPRSAVWDLSLWRRLVPVHSRGGLGSRDALFADGGGVRRRRGAEHEDRDQVEPLSEIVTAAAALAQKIANGPLAVQAMLAQAQSWADSGDAAAFGHSVPDIIRLLNSDDAREAMRAMAEARLP